jgi:hypothetical protein
MNEIIKHSVRFTVLILIQSFVLNQLEIGLGIQLLIYPLFVFLLPFELGVIPMLLLSFLMGLIIDSISNTYGLHASSLTLFAYLRPIIFKTFSPREGYDMLKEPNIFEMGNRWFIYTFGILLFIHHFWFFLLEMFRIDAFFFILQKTLLSFPLSFAFCILLQMLLISKPKTR